MPVHNEDIARIFDQIADLLEIEGANPFRIRAYRNASRTLRELGQDVRLLREAGEDLTRLPGIGKDLAAKIAEIIETGRCRALEKLQKRLPPDLSELLRIPGLGPKRVHALYHDLDIHTLEQLERAARDGRIRELPGFGAKTEARILETLAAHADSSRRFKLAVAAQYAEPLLAYLRALPGVEQAEVAGSYRRAKETVGDLDILAIAEDGEAVTRAFTEYDEVENVLSQGPTRATVLLRSGLQVDLRVVPAESYGAALYYFTGSRAHNIAVRRLAQKRGLKFNEYGAWRGRRRVAGDTEPSMFRAIGLPFIPPELRENRGEIEAARAGLLPKLVELGDLRGDLHCHSRASDGHASIRQMAEAARDHGFEYLAITEHSKRLTVARGLDSRRLLQQIEAIDELNEKLGGITLLKGIEVDILEDGSLDMPDAVLARLDLVIGAVHSKFDLSRAKQTRRILRAMDNPYFTLLAHPSGRLIERRAPYDVDMNRVIHHARQRGCYLELNAHPERLDLLDTHCQMAREEGVLVSINSDAHSVQDFDNLRFGVGQARRGWLEKKDVLNTRSLAQLRRLLKKVRG
ncbi:DNA polymerase/3'-5' exonuclease PolX [Thiohalobacter sp. IOR34]|uniref:DNA polymerase/3'-5' exonuclease PolX n=1 Tax=Thiohalobacter sp. IOR34 TaxID=3057176 RepID=UPI0025B07C75|nr:DNA polymerase/3'-5' exonuclease PolX [Thiohalobacter sp. IOR34]WJW76631.1 DNA polymerase/3'-5' exonuclease PolX [Thiohalobacter sp. IOR34]